MIHQYRLNGYSIVLDVNSGAVHVVDEIVYDLLEKLVPPLQEECPEEAVRALEEKYKREDVLAAYEEIMELYQAGLLFSADDYE